MSNNKLTRLLEGCVCRPTESIMPIDRVAINKMVYNLKNNISLSISECR